MTERDVDADISLYVEGDKVVMSIKDSDGEFTKVNFGVREARELTTLLMAAIQKIETA